MSELQDIVSRSSQLMAAIRALETKRPDRLFEDPYAAQLAGSEIIAQVEPKLKEYGIRYVEVRTRFFDDFMVSSASQIGQIVILGAGMDTRAFRLPWPPETRLYELDRLEVLQKKESILQDSPAKALRICVAADLGQAWSSQLLATGFQPEQPTLWLLEGLIYYLNETEVDLLLKTISELSAIGSCLGADLLNVKLIQEAVTEWSQSYLGDLPEKSWRYGCDEPEKLFTEHAWQASVVQPGDEGAHFGRFTLQFPPREVPDVSRCFFVTANKV
ncbi:MAG: SAM-dependent methyltransferase [Oscillatoria sp. SIO1A7]|nr:SAM-dependent methyltransferase [Oscillatoria sp. SIO1A7]